jgi:hypothetical protein
VSLLSMAYEAREPAPHTRVLALRAGTNTEAANLVEFTDQVTGKVRRVTIDQATQQGLVARAGDGTHAVTAGGAHLGARIVGGGTGSTDQAPPQPTVSTRVGRLARYPMLTANILRIASAHGSPKWQHVYFAANGVNRLANGAILPTWLTGGPVKMALDAAIGIPMLTASLAELSGAQAAYRAALQAPGPASGVVAQTSTAAMRNRARALMVRLPDTPPTVATPGRPNIPALARFSPLIKPLVKTGMSISSVASLAMLPEYLAQEGASGLLTTRRGRSAVLGALSGASTLASLWLPATPLQAYSDAVSSAAFLAELVNGYGWLDPLLGADKPGATARK